MEEADFLVTNQLFDSIGIVEKGIERIYHYLLVHKKIENLKEVCEKFGLSLKRGYKVASVLNELNLVQIYDRPMKIHLNQPVVPIWQELINARIEELRNQFMEKKNRCESAFEQFIKKYNLSDEPQSEPVEFLSININNIPDLFYVYTSGKSSRIALSIRYDNPFILELKKYLNKELPKNIKEPLIKSLIQLKNEMQDKDIKVIFSKEYLDSTINTQEFKFLTEFIESFSIQFKNIEVRVFEQGFSNFSLTDDELIQPCFDPSNILIGFYISRSDKIYQIFSDKFNEIFKNAKPINEFLKKVKYNGLKSLSDIQAFILTLL